MVKKSSDVKIIVNGVALTLKELKVLELNYEGKSNGEIAAKSGLKINRVKKMQSCSDDSRSIYQKIGVSSRQEAAVWIYRYYYEPKESNLIEDKNIFEVGAVARAEEKTKLALKLQWTVISLVDKTIAHSSNQALNFELEKVKFFAITEIIRTTHDIEPAEKAVQNSILFLEKLEEIATKYDDEELHAIVQLLTVEAYYVNQDYQSALVFLEKAHPITIPYEQMRRNRFKIVSLANIGDESGFNELEPLVFEQAEQANEMGLDMSCCLLEGTGRGQAKFRNDKYEETLGEKWNEYAQHIGLPIINIRRTQLARSKLAAGVMVNKIKEKDIEEAKKEIVWAEEGELVRYVQIINHLLDIS